MNQPYRKATMYVLNEYGYDKIEARDVECRFIQQAQYPNAIALEFTPKSARSRKRWGVTQPLVILEGWGHPEQEVWVESVRNGCTVAEPRFSFCDKAWEEDFDALLEQYLAANPNILVLADYRNHQFEQSVIADVDCDSDPFADNEPAIEAPEVSNVVMVATEPSILIEGDVKEVIVSVHERNPEARRRCVEYYGWDCSICGFNFRTAYGGAGADFIHVHHLTPISQIPEAYIVDPVEDLRPVCANCHSIIHRRTPPYSIEEMAGFLKGADSSSKCNS